MKFTSFLLVFVQFSLLLFFALSGNLLARQWPLLFTESLGIALALWAIVVMNYHTLSIFPEPKRNGNLIVSGPYQFIRHPMYTAILLVCLSLVVADQSVLKWCMFTLLTVNQLIKLHVEETMLLKHYPEYEGYRKVTKKLIPFVY